MLGQFFKNLSLIIGYSVLVYSTPTSMGLKRNSYKRTPPKTKANKTSIKSVVFGNKSKYTIPITIGRIATFHAESHLVNIIRILAPNFLFRTTILRIITEILAKARDTAIPKTPYFTPQ